MLDKDKDYKRKCFRGSWEIQRAGQHIAKSRNSCLPTRMHPVKTSLKTFHIKFTQKKVQYLAYD